MEDPRYNDSVCYQRFCCKIEFAVIKKLDLGPCKAWITDILKFFFDKSYVEAILANIHNVFFPKNIMGLSTKK